MSCSRGARLREETRLVHSQDQVSSSLSSIAGFLLTTNQININTVSRGVVVQARLALTLTLGKL